MGTFDALGFNARLTDIQAAVGVAQMAKLDALLRERKHRAKRDHRSCAATFINPTCFAYWKGEWLDVT